MTGKRGAQPVYADIAIETALALRLLFHLPLRQTEGFLGSVLRLMGLLLPCPDHTTLSRRNATIGMRQQVDRASKGSISLSIYTTGVKVCGQGEYSTKKHGDKKRRPWKKLYHGVDDGGCILTPCATDGHKQNLSQVKLGSLSMTASMIGSSLHGLTVDIPISASPRNRPQCSAASSACCCARPVVARL